MNPREVKIASRLRELIAEGTSLSSKAFEESREWATHKVYTLPIMDLSAMKELAVKTTNILITAFGENSPHYQFWVPILRGSFGNTDDLAQLNGILTAALSDLEGGFLSSQEILTAADIFDHVLQQAEELLKKGYKDPAAMLGRVVLEDSLRRLAKKHSIPDHDTAKASVLNDALKQAGIYNQPQWRQIQAWLDIGNSAAHGKFDGYSAEQVGGMLKDAVTFIGAYLN